MYGPNTATEKRSTLATDRIISRLSPVSRLILSILSVRASHQYNVFSWEEILNCILHGGILISVPQKNESKGQCVGVEMRGGGGPFHQKNGPYLIVDGNSVGPHNARVDQGDLV